MKNILFYGAKSQCLITYNILYKKLFKKKYFPKYSQATPKYSYDENLNKPYFKSPLIFSNNKDDLKKFIKKSDFFVNCIGSNHGYARCVISKKLQDFSLEPLNIVSKTSVIDETVLLGNGNIIMNSATINLKSEIGNFCIVNTNATIDHECKINDGTHIMGGVSIAGRVNIGKYVTIGTNATILPDIVIEDGAYIGAGAVVTKNIKKNQIVVGNPAKFLKKKKHLLPKKIT